MPVVAIWDTGATGSAISQKLAREMTLSPTGVASISGIGIEDTLCSTYTVEIMLSETMGKLNGTMIEAPQIGEADILLGMDIITMGDFAITSEDGNTVVSFCFPSRKPIDFVPIVNDAILKARRQQSRQQPSRRRSRRSS